MSQTAPRRPLRLAPMPISPQTPSVETVSAPASRPLGVLIVALLALASGCATTSGARSISGHILGKTSFEDRAQASPVENARVQLRVVEPASKRPEEGPRFKLPHGIDALTNLRGVAVTKSNGVYAFENLFTPWVDDEEHPLIQGWQYEIEIVAAGYYIFRESFVYEGEKVQVRDWILEEKPHNVEDTTGGVSENTHLMRKSVSKRFE